MAQKEYKQLNCRDVDAKANCDFMVRAETEEEIMRVASGHAQRHGIREFTPELKEKMRSFIKTVRV